jgi:HD-like signal output (HDOD) protein
LGLVNYFDNLAFPRSGSQKTSAQDALKIFEENAGTRFSKELISDYLVFVESNSDDSGSYLLKKETIYIRKAFTRILQKFMAGELTPPVVPRVARDIQSVFKGDPSNVLEDEVAGVVEKDPVISLRLISIANSPAYRGVSEVRNVRAAIPRLGLKETLSLVIAVSQKSLYQTDKTHFKLLMDKLWVHSLATAYGAKLLGQKLNLADPDNLFLLGLTHDIGKIFLLKAFTDILDVRSLHMDAINANLQGGHIGVSSKLLKRWGFDNEFIRILTDHDSDEYEEDTDPQILILHMSNMLTRRIGFSLMEDETDLSTLEAARILKLNAALIDQVGNEVQQIIQSVAHLF